MKEMETYTAEQLFAVFDKLTQANKSQLALAYIHLLVSEFEGIHGVGAGNIHPILLDVLEKMDKDL